MISEKCSRLSPGTSNAIYNWRSPISPVSVHSEKELNRGKIVLISFKGLNKIILGNKMRPLL